MLPISDEKNTYVFIMCGIITEMFFSPDDGVFQVQKPMAMESTDCVVW
jgi:hypothetical protein